MRPRADQQILECRMAARLARIVRDRYAGKFAIASLIAMVLAVQGFAQEPPRPRFKAVAFDYFVIFDPNSVIPAVEEACPGRGAEFTRAWRAKQFEYGFLRSITHRHVDFFKATE